MCFSQALVGSGDSTAIQPLIQISQTVLLLQHKGVGAVLAGIGQGSTHIVVRSIDAAACSCTVHLLVLSRDGFRKGHIALVKIQLESSRIKGHPPGEKRCSFCHHGLHLGHRCARQRSQQRMRAPCQPLRPWSRGRNGGKNFQNRPGNQPDCHLLLNATMACTAHLCTPTKPPKATAPMVSKRPNAAGPNGHFDSIAPLKSVQSVSQIR